MMVTMMEKIDGVIFDYGGTLDSRGEHWSHVIRRGYERAGLNVGPECFRQAYVHGERTLAKERHILPHHTFRELMEIKIAIELHALVDWGAVSAIDADRSCSIIAGYCYDSARACVGESEATLRRLSKAGVPMALVSNFYGNIEAVLKDFGIVDCFDAIVESAVVGVRKPDPQIFTLGVDALGLPSERVLVVGDSYSKDIVPAQRAGCKALWLRGSGWDDSEADIVYPYIIHSVREVERLVLG